ncbi:LysR substrate-binding domain-containing protein [Vibrio sonorensis]|uniref:LysR substrate-binding domain-containing protein n=1 Tax=Vibrio sonorensis TaxID=1004316 RepID=UPI0008D91E46|nr:LysR substrate-binding domain-containing protein [Vibrio sonorensis]
MKEKMPPLQGLYYFYIAAQQGSFKKAAEQLFVTSAAISQQIRALEDWLGTELFVRQHRKVVLTEEGRLLYEQAGRGFSHIQEGVRLINTDPNPYQLSISTPPSFAQHWLVSRIGDFRSQHPELSFLLEPTNRLVTFEDSSVDLCIRYGEGTYPKIESRWLMDDVVYPVCHPLYREKHNIMSVKDLTRADLIEDMWPDMDWSLYLENLGYSGGRSTLRYDGSHFVLEGALAVQGVALVKHSIAARYIDEGKLVRIGNQALRPKFKYFLCAPAGYFKRPKVQQFQQWLIKEVAQFQATYPLVNTEIIDTDFSLPWGCNRA